jgi:hypothetical protein
MKVVLPLLKVRLLLNDKMPSDVPGESIAPSP